MDNHDELRIFQKLVGYVTEKEFSKIKKNVEMYLTPKLSIFIPFLDYCEYAITPQHRHPSYSFIYYYCGPGEIRVYQDIKRSPFKNKPSLCVFSPDIPHEEIIQDQFKSYMAICIDKEFYESEMKNYPEGKMHTFTGDYFQGNELILNTLKRFIVEYSETLPCRDKLLGAIALEITHALIRHCNNVVRNDVRISQKMEINQLINYLNEQYSKKITIDQMAKQVNLSASHFIRIFREETGATPIDFLNNLRIEKAKKYLLNPEYSITDIAFSCGFSSSSYFTNCFSDRMGIGPREFRKKQLLM